LWSQTDTQTNAGKNILPRFRGENNVDSDVRRCVHGTGRRVAEGQVYGNLLLASRGLARGKTCACRLKRQTK